MSRRLCADYAGHFFLCHIKIVVAMVKEIAKNVAPGGDLFGQYMCLLILVKKNLHIVIFNTFSTIPDNYCLLTVLLM